MDLPPVSYAPRNRQRPLPIVLPVMAGLGIGVSALFVLAWGLLLLRMLRVRLVLTQPMDVAVAAIFLVAIASHMLLGLTAASLLRYRSERTVQLSRRTWASIAGLTLLYFGGVALSLSQSPQINPLLMLLGIYVVQMLYPAFLITTLRQPLIAQAYEREARRRASLSELESQS